jgi:hypothetical protein
MPKREITLGAGVTIVSVLLQPGIALAAANGWKLSPVESRIALGLTVVGILGGVLLLLHGLGVLGLAKTASGWRFRSPLYRPTTNDESGHEKPRGAITPHPLGQRLRAVSGETLVREVVSASPYQQYPLYGKPVTQSLGDLKLAEVALLRRMYARLEDKWQHSTPPGSPERKSMFGYENLSEYLSAVECEGILVAGGIANPRHSIVRLEGRHLIKTDAGGIVLLDQRIADTFTYYMSHDPLLVAAYLKVTLAIDKVIRLGAFERLIPDYASYENWLASLSL